MQLLAGALIASAVRDLIYGREVEDTRAWLDGAEALVTFDRCCELLDICATQARRRIVAVADDPESIGKLEWILRGAWQRRERELPVNGSQIASRKVPG